MATRPDLFSARFCSIFNDLHSNAPTHSESKTRKLLHDNNINIKSSSSTFLSKPLASGAIAQVYRCKVGNLDLIMKVRHPGVQNEIYYDLKILNIFTRLLTKFISKETFQWLNIEDNIQSFTKNMLLQTNLMIETKNLQIFEKNFQKYKANIRFPHVDSSLPATKDILFQTYENGQLLNEFMETCQDTKIRKQLAYLGVNAYLKMLFVDNFVRSIFGICIQYIYYYF
jgi:predicted unusual protein kinase regulating ubiquinone biosynthesis (AarF/ABC1/UbiB family)